MLKKYLVFGLIYSLMFPGSLAFAQSAGNFSLSVSPTSSTITQGARTSTSINVNGNTDVSNPPDGTSDVSIHLSVSEGLPSGITVEFSPSDVLPPGNSIMTVSADMSSPPGTYVIPINGSALGQTTATSFSITVAALPKFDYSASLVSSQGSAATGERVETTLNLSQLSGTSQAIVLSSSGQPSGVSVDFSPSTCMPPCSALVTFNVSSVTDGTYPITLSATAGSITKNMMYSLRIMPSSLSDFSLSIFPVSSTISPKDSVNALVNLTRLSGTSKSVSLAVVNQPPGSTAQISPSSCEPPCNALLTITTDETIKAGTYPVSVVGYAGGSTRNIAYTLIVDAPTATAIPITATIDTPMVTSGSSLQGMYFSRSFARGARGTDVSRLQEYLASDPSLYPEGVVSGYFGALSVKALGRFQFRYGIVKSTRDAGYGSFGPRTRAKLNAILAQ